MKHVKAGALLFVLLSTTCPSYVLSARNDLIDLTVRFGSPRVTDNGGPATVELQALPLSTEPGRAMLPFRPVRILLPFGKTVKSLSVTPGRSSFRVDDLIVGKAPAIGPISFFGKRRRRFLRLYPSARPKRAKRIFPESLYSSRGVQCWYGYRFLDLNLYPVRYDEAESRLWAVDKINIRMELTTLSRATPCSPLDEDRTRVARLVENPQVLTTYAAHKARRKEPCDYLIIASDELARLEGPDSLADFSRFLSERGLKTAVVSVENIISGSGTQQEAQKLIRAFIKEYYDTHGIKFVLLVGDAYRTGTKGIPAATLFAEFTWEGRRFRADLPADVYYTLLDGEFDHDGDGHFGEATDGDNGAEVDLYAEVSIGRLPVDTEQQLRLLVRRSMRAYAIADEGSRRQILFAGENLFPGLWGRQYMEELEFGADTHGFHTVGVPDDYVVDHLFDLTTPARYSWTSSDLIGKINNGVYQLHHIGHSATWMALRCYAYTLGNITTDKPFFIYTQGCQAGRFTVDDCIIERFLFTPHGAFACIANSNYGLGPEDPDDDDTVHCRGASQYFHRQFLNIFWQTDTRTLGELNQRSKEANIPWMHHGTTRWVFWELNLLGDPNIPLLR